MATVIPRNEAQFSLAEVLSATRGNAIYMGHLSAQSVTTDSRALSPGALFVALSGERFDAHNFLNGVVDAGAHIIVVQDCPAVDELVQRCKAGQNNSPPTIVLVADTLLALGDLGHFHRQRFDLKVAAVVGSAGKTTTRSVISALLQVVAPGQAHCTVGNLNNRIGVPMTLLGITDEHRFAVLELGTNCPGEVARLSQITEPDVAVLTLIDLEHTEGLGDLDGVEAEEAAIFDHINPEGCAIGYGEDPRVLRRIQAAASAQRIIYGEKPGCDLEIVSRRFVSPRQVELLFQRSDGSTLQFLSGLLGRAGALAAAAGVVAVENLTQQRLSSEACEQALSEAGEPGRHSLVELSSGRWIVDDSYNSNPASVPHSIQTGIELAAVTGGRLWLVLGEMLELGQLSESSHQLMGELAAQSGARGAFFVQGDARLAELHCRGVLEYSAFFPSSQGVVDELAPLMQERDVVVVKASRGVQAELVVQGLISLLQPVLAAVSPQTNAGSDHISLKS